MKKRISTKVSTKHGGMTHNGLQPYAVAKRGLVDWGYCVKGAVMCLVLNKYKMENYIEITKIVKERVPLLRKPTSEELAMIKKDEMFDIEEKLIDWDNSETIEEDYSYGSLKVQFENKQLYNRDGRH